MLLKQMGFVFLLNLPIMYYTDFSVYAQNTTASSTREAKLDLDLSLRPSLSLPSSLSLFNLLGFVRSNSITA